MFRIIAKMPEMAVFEAPSEVGQRMQAPGDRDKMQTRKAIYHDCFSVLQRWQNYHNIAPYF
jgi:hypothetical protein